MVFAKKPPLLVTIGTALLLIGGGTLAYLGVQWQIARGKGLPVGVRAIPQDAVAVVTVSTDPEQWQNLRQFGTPETQANFDQQLADWRDRWLTEYGISFSQDIEPWVGSEITLAWISDFEAGLAQEPGAIALGDQQRIALLPIADPEAAQLSAESLPLAGEAETALEYRGVKLQQFLPPSEDETKTLLVGLLGTQLILIAEDEGAAQQAIDAYKGGKNLGDLAGYRRSFETVGVPNSFAKVYLNIPAAVQLLSQSSQPALPAALLESFQDGRGLAATVTLASQGLHVKSTSWLGSGSDLAYVDTDVPAVLPDYLPRDTLVMASGGNFQQFWDDLRNRRNWGALTALNPDNLALALQGTTGLNLDSDLLPWMKGEFAIALVPSLDTRAENSEVALPNPGLITLVQVSDRPQAEQAFARLDEVVENRYRFTITDEPKGDIELVKWTSPFESVALSRGWLDSSIAFLTVGQGTETTIVPKPRRSLATAPLFQLTTGDAPYPNNGYFYLNLEALSQTTNNLFLPALPVENQGMLRAIQAIGVTASVVDEQRLHYDLFLALKRGNRPGPLPRAQAAADTEPATPEAAPAAPTPAAPAPEAEAEAPAESAPEAEVPAATPTEPEAASE